MAIKDAQDKLDRRVRQTRDTLLDALLSLMMERGYERLTIQNLLDRADIGRATFYAHFDSKDELLACSIARLRSWLVTEWRAMPDQRLGFTLPFFQHLASHRVIYQKTIVRESEVSVERHIRQMLRELVREDLAARCSQEPGGRGDASLDLATQYVIGAMWATIVWWMESGTSLPPEEINALFQRLAFPGLDVTLGEML
ncbi:MAG: TetR/AcrR family transcriptional regulator [Pseudomonadota bacterium]